MKTLDQRGAVALEFVLCGALFFALVFSIFDIARYAITILSLQKLANAGARAAMICSTSTVANFNQSVASSSPTWPATCTQTAGGSTLLTVSTMGNLAPMLISPSLSVPAPAAGAKTLTATASSSFTILVPLWWRGVLKTTPTATATVPFSS
jgi:Flp pilus assembly protein TadG